MKFLTTSSNKETTVARQTKPFTKGTATILHILIGAFHEEKVARLFLPKQI